MSNESEAMNEYVTLQTALSLGKIIDGCIGNQIVTWEDPEMRGLRTGTMRAIVRNEAGGLIGGDDNVLNGRVWITARSGFEVFLPVSQALDLQNAGLFAVGYDADAVQPAI